MGDYRFIGREHSRPDAADKAAGRARYIHDLSRPGMLHGKIKFSEHAHARIIRIETSRAERLPGVRAVISGFNTPEVRLGFLRDNVALKRDKVRQFRDEIAAVAAIDPDIASEAIDRIVVEYEPLPGVFDPEEALGAGAPLVHESDPDGRPRGGDLPGLPFPPGPGAIPGGWAGQACGRRASPARPSRGGRCTPAPQSAAARNPAQRPESSTPTAVPIPATPPATCIRGGSVAGAKVPLRGS